MTDKSPATERIEKQLREMGPDYLKRRETELREFQNPALEFNLKRLETLGHRMKGSAKSYGYEKLGVLGADLEEAAHNEDAPGARLVLNQILTFISSVNSPNQVRE